MEAKTNAMLIIFLLLAPAGSLPNGPTDIEAKIEAMEKQLQAQATDVIQMKATIKAQAAQISSLSVQHNVHTQTKLQNALHAEHMGPVGEAGEEATHTKKGLPAHCAHLPNGGRDSQYCGKVVPSWTSIKIGGKKIAGQGWFVIACTDTSSPAHNNVKQMCPKMCHPECDSTAAIASCAQYMKNADTEYAKLCPQFASSGFCQKPDGKTTVNGFSPEKMMKYHKITLEHCQGSCGICDPSTNNAFVGPGSPTFVPEGNLVLGHRHCKDRFTLSTVAGNTFNDHTGLPSSVAVCGTCRKGYVLHPAYTFRGRVLGVCKKMEEHPEFLKVQKNCPTCSKSPCSTQCKSMITQCHEFVGNWGLVKNPEDGKLLHTHGKSSDRPPNGKAVAFTCGRVYETQVHDQLVYRKTTKAVKNRWYSHILEDKDFTDLAANVYRVMQTNFVECHSTKLEENGVPKMQCVNRKSVRSCHSKLLSIAVKDGGKVWKTSATIRLNLQSQANLPGSSEMRSFKAMEARARAQWKINGILGGAPSGWKQCDRFDSMRITGSG